MLDFIQGTFEYGHSEGDLEKIEEYFKILAKSGYPDYEIEFWENYDQI
jgi:hypothetical protein